MDSWLRRPLIVLPSPAGREPAPKIGDWSQVLVIQKSPAMPEQPRNVYWVPVKRKHDSAPIETLISPPHSFTTRQNIPTLDERSTAGVIAAIVLFVVIVMGVLVFLIWRTTRYKSKTKVLKLEAAEIAQATDAHREMRMSSNAASLAMMDSIFGATVEERRKSATSGRTRDVESRHGLSTYTDDDARSFRTAVASIRTSKDAGVHA